MTEGELGALSTPIPFRPSLRERSRIRLEFKPADLWIGAFLKIEEGETFARTWRTWHLWLCLLPMVPIHVEYELNDDMWRVGCDSHGRERTSRCPNCGERFEPFQRQLVYSFWRAVAFRPSRALICRACKEIVAWEYPAKVA